MLLPNLFELMCLGTQVQRGVAQRPEARSRGLLLPRRRELQGRVQARAHVRPRHLLVRQRRRVMAPLLIRLLLPSCQRIRYSFHRCFFLPVDLLSIYKVFSLEDFLVHFQIEFHLEC